MEAFNKPVIVDGDKQVRQDRLKRYNRNWIDNTSRDELPDFFIKMGFKRGAEIGVYKAEYTEKFCQAGLIMYAIDPWRAFWGQGRTQQVQKRQDFLYEHAQRVLAPYISTTTIIRKDSMDAVSYFRDEALDFVYIDGDHNFKHIAMDIYEWSKKVKKGGIVAGHDYWSTNPKAQNVICQVKPVVNAYIEAFGIEDLWIFGQSNLSNEKALSWMFVKK